MFAVRTFYEASQYYNHESNLALILDITIQFRLLLTTALVQISKCKFLWYILIQSESV